MYQWNQPTETRAEDVIGCDVLHFDGDLIDSAVMFIPGFEALNVPGHDGPQGPQVNKGYGDGELKAVGDVAIDPQQAGDGVNQLFQVGTRSSGCPTWLRQGMIQHGDDVWGSGQGVDRHELRLPV